MPMPATISASTPKSVNNVAPNCHGRYSGSIALPIVVSRGIAPANSDRMSWAIGFLNRRANATGAPRTINSDAPQVFGWMIERYIEMWRRFLVDRIEQARSARHRSRGSARRWWRRLIRQAATIEVDAMPNGILIRPDRVGHRLIHDYRVRTRSHRIVGNVLPRTSFVPIAAK